MELRPQGVYVRLQDYLELEAKVERLRRERDAAAIEYTPRDTPPVRATRGRRRKDDEAGEGGE